MADTRGLMETRAEWEAEVEEGKTSKPHRDWYEEKYGNKENLSDVLAERQKNPKPSSLQQIFK